MMEHIVQIDPEVMSKAMSWLVDAVDEQTQSEVRELLKGDPKELAEAFQFDLEFGTGGLRGIMGVGTSRMNRYTVGKATQGLANYINGVRGSGSESSVAIAFDSRNGSPEFARTAADVLTANGIRVFLFPELRPTPFLSFAVRELGCTAGIVITASHNPKEYNGYKVYWEDGAQVLPPHDRGIMAAVKAIGTIDQIRFTGNQAYLMSPQKTLEARYYERLKNMVFAQSEIVAHADLSIVYTSLHGAGITMVPEALRQSGFRNVHVVAEQATPDGNFPTVDSPNPEERAALDLALQLAVRENAELVMGTDPDTDRVGIAIRNEKGELELLNGNQAGAILVWYELSRWKENNRLKGNQYIASTIVTSDVFPAIAEKFGVPCYLTLTGFKYIAAVMRDHPTEQFVAGGEESYGYLAGDFVRDKDAVISSLKFAEIAAWCKSNGLTMWDLLMQIYVACGLYSDQLVSVTLKGIEGMTRIKEKMRGLREQPPSELGGVSVVRRIDVLQSSVFNVETGTTSTLDLPHSDVLQFELADGSRISARPSGTEPKIKFYLSLRSPFAGIENYRAQLSEFAQRTNRIRQELGL